MPGPPPAVAVARLAVRRAVVAAGLAQERTWDPAADPGPDAPALLVACSGGTDSLALAAATAFVAPRLRLRAGALVVDHRLQDGSPEAAEAAAATCRRLGLDPVTVVPVSVPPAREGPEAAARSARYAALAAGAQALGAPAVLLGHTLDDQAEQVLLGLARGSGSRSLAGMRPCHRLRGGPLLLRPFLDLPRAQTRAVCAAAGLEPWQDPHNADPRFARVRARRALECLEAELGPGVAGALARTAELLRDDASALEELSDAAYRDLGEPPWAVTAVERLPRAVRTRLWRRLALAAGSPGTDLTAHHLLAVDALVTGWHGQGPVHLPGGVRAGRGRSHLWLAAASPPTMGREPDRSGPTSSDEE